MLLLLKAFILTLVVVVASAERLRSERGARCIGVCQGKPWPEPSQSAESRGTRSWGDQDEVFWTREVVVDSKGIKRVVETPLGKAYNEGNRRSLENGWLKSTSRLFPFTSIGRVDLVFGSKTFFCTGTLVAPSIVLTAAHCVLNSQGELTTDITFKPNQIPTPSSPSSSSSSSSSSPSNRASPFLYPVPTNGSWNSSNSTLQQGSEEDSGTEERSPTSGNEARVIGVYGHVSVEDSYLTYADRDWMFLYLNKPLGQKYGWMRLSIPPKSIDSSEGVLVSVAGYARDAQCDQGDSLCVGQGSMIRTGGNANEGAYTIPTAGGSSGGPVFTFDQSSFSYRIVAIHVRASDSGIKFGVLTSAFIGELEAAKKKALMVASDEENHREGVVCTEHSHCDEFTFCSNRNARCFRCDACPSEDRAFKEVNTFDGNACPDKCVVASSSQSDELDIDSDTCVVGGVENVFEKAVCENKLCLDQSLCGLVTEPRENVKYYDFGGQRLPKRFADVFTIHEGVLESFKGDAKRLAQARGYRTGGVLNSGDIIGFGSVYMINEEGLDQSSGDTDGETDQPEESSNGGSAAGPILFSLIGVAAVVAFALYVRRVQTKYQNEDEPHEIAVRQH